MAKKVKKQSGKKKNYGYQTINKKALGNMNVTKINYHNKIG